jgi:SAM-dependent methyltransferase
MKRRMVEKKCLFVEMIFFALCASRVPWCFSFSPVIPPDKEEGDSILTSRRDLLWKLPIGAVGSYVYGRICYNAFAVQGINYPKEHEHHVESTIRTALLACTRPGMSHLKVLEVGIGKDVRLLRRGLYDEAFENLHAAGVQHIELVGVDPLAPTDATMEAARQSSFPLQVDIDYLQGSIESELSYDDGYFDAIVCCLTLCSVDDVAIALKEINRLLRPDGGCFGYVEHVAVDPDEPYRFLEIQQEVLDPVQQILADNCHLHRSTQQSIADEFLTTPSAVTIATDRYLVDTMWPVSCQACGVLQKQAPSGLRTV